MKKFLLVVPIVVLLAAGCNSSSPSQDTSNTDNSGESQQMTATPTPVPSPTAMPSGMMMNDGSTWQGTLKASDNSAKGNYMLISGNHTIYLRTSRDYSSLVGKMVSVSYSGTMDSFTLGDIMAK